MSFMYPRVVSTSRPNSTTPGQLGDVGYNAQRGPSDESPVLSGLPASIQLDRQGQKNPTGLPSDAQAKPIWKVFIPKGAAPLGSIQSADIVTDDLGVRYQVFSPYWNSLGHRLGCIILEV
jgi:hypothetical protein